MADRFNTVSHIKNILTTLLPLTYCISRSNNHSYKCRWVLQQETMNPILVSVKGSITDQNKREVNKVPFLQSSAVTQNLKSFAQGCSHTTVLTLDLPLVTLHPLQGATLVEQACCASLRPWLLQIFADVDVSFP